MQIEELLQDENFQEYRKREMGEALDLLRGEWGGKRPEYWQGVMDLLNRIVNLPGKIAKSPGLKEFAEIEKARTFASFEVGVLRKAVFADDIDGEKGE